MDWVTENIAIGNFKDAQNVATSEVDSILCLRPDCCDEEREDLDIFCLPLVDGAGNNKRSFDDAVDFIDDIVENNERLLVHCHAGRSRSVCIVARYLMMKQGLSSYHALQMIKVKREIYLSPGIEEILEL